MAYRLTYARGVERDIARLPRDVLIRVDAAILALAETPRPAKSIKLKGAQRLWRIRLGDWRVVYEIDDASQLVEIQIVAHRREVYRGR